MAKTNEFKLTGNVSSIESKFLQNGAEVCNIVLTWDEESQYPGCAAVDFYAAKGLDKLNKLEIKIGNSVTIPCTPFSKLKEGVSTKTGESYRFYETKLRGDSWGVVVNGGAPKVEDDIAF